MSIFSYPHIQSTLISDPPDLNLGIVVCIPCYNENDVGRAIESLLQCEKPSCHVEIIVLINEAIDCEESITTTNKASYESIHEVIDTPIWLTCYAVYVQDMPVKRAGVGLARKLAMDEAYARLQLSQSDHKIISCYDADCTCSPTYFTAQYSFFESNRKLDACSIYYEHDIDSENDQEITTYESHLRYFIQIQRMIRLPFAFQTVGSSMAVRASGYKQVGGMNQRKAGEDFYFLQKFIANFKCGEVNTTAIYPSARESDRVPFGTGRAILQMKKDQSRSTTYDMDSFIILQSFLEHLHDIYHNNEALNISEYVDNPEILAYLTQEDVVGSIAEIKQNTSNYPSFYKRFYQWFGAFRLMKYLHYMRDNGYPNIGVDVAVKWLLEQYAMPNHDSLKENLAILRKYERESNYAILVQSWPNL